MAMVNRFEIYLVNLDETVTDDPKNTRPALVISPDEMNRHLDQALIAPIASTKTLYPTRVPIHFLNSERSVILDQIRTVETVRLFKKIGDADRPTQKAVLIKLQEIFAE
jgi:mRNA interferase MazF